MYRIKGGDGSEYGPADLALMQRWVQEHRIAAHTLVQAEGTQEWRPLSSYPELAQLVVSSPPPLAPQTPAPVRPYISPDIPTYLIPAILCTLLCCIPLGIPAIVYASQVTSKQIKGDVAGAQRASRNARTWCWVSFVVGVIVIVIMSIATGSLLSSSVFRF